MFKFVGLVMKFAPIGIGAAIAVTVGQSGIGVLKNLGVLVLTPYGSLIVFATGYAFNMDGTTLYLAMASVFVAQAAGIDMGVPQQLLMMFTLMLTSTGENGTTT